MMKNVYTHTFQIEHGPHLPRAEFYNGFWVSYSSN